jgi:hypothetical protein
MERPMGLVLMAMAMLVLLVGCVPAMTPTKETTFQQIIELPGIPKDVIYEKSRIWIAKTFRSSKAVLEYENKETGVIIGKGIVTFADPRGMGITVEAPVQFTMTEEIKDGKVRIIFENLLHADTSTPVRDQKHVDKIRPKLMALANNLGAFISNKKTKNDW